MKIRYMLAIAMIMGASIAQAALVSEWVAGAGVNTNGVTVWTDSVSGNNLTFNTLNQSATLVDVSGQSFNSAYLFGGAYPYRAFKSWPSYFGSLTDASVAIWFNVNDLDANYILWSDGAGSGYSLSVDTNGAVRGLLKAGANVNDDAMINISGGTVSAGRWYHLAMTIDGANDEVRLYLNGSEVASSTATAFGDFSGTDHTAMGGKNLTKMGGADTDGGGDPTDDVSGFSTLEGQVSLVQVYNNELSAGEVLALYNIPSAPGNLVATENPPGTVTLTWKDNSANEEGFIIEQSSDDSTYSVIHTNAANDTTNSIFGLGAATYYFRVKAYNTGGDSAYATTTSITTTSSGVDVRAYETAEGVIVEFVAYDVEADGSIVLALMDANGDVVWQGSVAVTAGPQFFARFPVPGLELGETYNFQVRDEVGKWWDANGVTVGSFAAEMTSATLAGITISFDSLPDREYEIQWAADLSSEWTTVKTLTTSGSVTSAVVPYPEQENTTGFFRVKLK